MPETEGGEVVGVGVSRECDGRITCRVYMQRVHSVCVALR